MNPSNTEPEPEPEPEIGIFNPNLLSICIMIYCRLEILLKIDK